MSYDPYTPPDNPYQQPPPMMRPPAQTSGFAITSMVLGILGICGSIMCIGGVLGIPAIIFGHLARGAIRRSNGSITGDGMAIAGLICGYIAIVILVFFIGMVVVAETSSSPSSNYYD